MLWGWLFGFAVAGLALGAITNGATDLVRGNRQLEDAVRHLGGAPRLTDSYLASMVSTLGMVAAIYAVQAVLRLNGEESGGRAEPVLATAVGRMRWAASHLVVAAIGGAGLLVVGGTSMGIGYGATAGGIGHQIARLTGASLVQLPAVCLVGALTLLIYAATPKAAVAGWSIASLTFATGLYGPVLNVNHWVLDLSAFRHLPTVPAEPVTAAPMLWLTALTIAVTAAGLIRLRQRDMT